MSNKLFVSRIRKLDYDQLMGYFTQFGPILDLVMCLREAEMSKTRSALVIYERAGSAAAALQSPSPVINGEKIVLKLKRVCNQKLAEPPTAMQEAHSLEAGQSPKSEIEEIHQEMATETPEAVRVKELERQLQELRDCSDEGNRVIEDLSKKYQSASAEAERLRNEKQELETQCAKLKEEAVTIANLHEEEIKALRERVKNEHSAKTLVQIELEQKIWEWDSLKERFRVAQMELNKLTEAAASSPPALSNSSAVGHAGELDEQAPAINKRPAKRFFTSSSDAAIVEPEIP